ncbi:hypothetical protein [Pararobbsia alpina]|uniref:Uncharacterized protein n=1 Tax=Pararobbsia alpina TaxID=621374 RepID=A0A6S7B3Y1_9BURK|nr:hypothetical protein [Pararobbsia alpina]CAB3787035.1 hypothetical protein LMG28138_02346 [Pararobbsia alpina]
MSAATGLLFEVHRSPALTIALGSFFAGCAIALYLSASAAAGPFAGVAASLAGVAWLAWCARRQARGCPRWLWLAEQGSVEWCDRMGRPGAGQAVAAVRVGGLWVSLSAQPDRQTREQGETRAGERGAVPRMRSIPSFGKRTCAWLLPADALDPEAFRALAVRVPRIPSSRP